MPTAGRGKLIRATHRQTRKTCTKLQPMFKEISRILLVKLTVALTCLRGLKKGARVNALRKSTHYKIFRLQLVYAWIWIIFSARFWKLILDFGNRSWKNSITLKFLELLTELSLPCSWICRTNTEDVNRALLFHLRKLFYPKLSTLKSVDDPDTQDSVSKIALYLWIF